MYCLREDYALNNFNLIKFKMADLRCLSTLIGLCVISEKLCQIPGPLLYNKKCGFREVYALNIFNPIKFKMAKMLPLLTLLCVISGDV